MLATINYRSSDINLQPSSINIEVLDRTIPETEQAWKKLILDKLGFANTMTIKSFSLQGNIIDVELETRFLPKTEQVLPLASDIYPVIFKYINPKTYQKFTITAPAFSTAATAAVAKATAKMSAFEMFKQKSFLWRILPTEKIQEAVSANNLEKLLAKINFWLIEFNITFKKRDFTCPIKDYRLYRWIDTFGPGFEKFFSALNAEQRTLELNAIFALVTSNVTQLNLEDLKASADAIKEKYPAIYTSLMATYNFLTTGRTDESLQYWNLSGIDINDKNFRSRVKIKTFCSTDEAYFSSKKFYGVNLRGANFSKSFCDEALFMNANFENANLHGAMLSANLENANFRGAILSEVRLEKAILSSADLSGANLSGLNFFETEFFKTNLRGANLRQSNLNWAKFQRAILTNADLTGAKINETDFNWAYFNRVICSEETMKQIKESSWRFLETDIKNADIAKLINYYKYLQRGSYQLWDIHKETTPINYKERINKAVLERTNQLLIEAEQSLLKAEQLRLNELKNKKLLGELKGKIIASFVQTSETTASAAVSTPILK